MGGEAALQRRSLAIFRPRIKRHFRARIRLSGTPMKMILLRCTLFLILLSLCLPEFALAQAGLTLPWFRDRFYLEPNQTIHQVPEVTQWFRLGGGLWF